MCGGSLINTRYVLTAAHCIKTKSSVKLVAVRLGEHDKNTANDCIDFIDGTKHCAPEAYDVDIEEIIIYDQYNRPNRFQNDIALIRMAQKIKYSESVRPICLPVDERVRHQQLFKYVITGWGKTEKQTVSSVLLKATVDHVSIPECQQEMYDNFLAVTLVDPWQMCARGANLTDACKGDSGGPLGTSVAVDGIPKFVQFGIVSAGIRSCGKKGVSGIYTSVPAYMNWIVANMRP
ncbi:AGAP004855-PA-like protein [Anopheles sinensis]|uniref:AGAP004855-PA-like protein n=1 Tax=Anopheles sinensis TaxID=74873 RepID=A0A084VUB8_ANOSI|nr:AGAP004855-PA-like protein [Anopheles sinensis]